MTLPPWLEEVLQQWIGRFYARWPRQRSSLERLRKVKLVAHRGVHDNRRILENTLPAFAKAWEAGVWGIEFDVRWTRDRYPVVCHDDALCRLFGSGRRISDMTLRQLERDFPRVPLLDRVVREWGRRLHLMVELKGERAAEPLRQIGRLQEIFAPLVPGADFHFLSFSLPFFRQLSAFPPCTFLPIARFNERRVSRVVRREGYGGITGHFFLLRSGLIRQMEANGFGVGTGMADSLNSLFREADRGVTWIFSNRAESLQRVCRPPKAAGSLPAG